MAQGHISLSPVPFRFSFDSPSDPASASAFVKAYSNLLGYHMWSTWDRLTDVSTYRPPGSEEEDEPDSGWDFSGLGNPSAMQDFMTACDYFLRRRQPHHPQPPPVPLRRRPSLAERTTTTSSSATSPCSSPTPPEPGWSICFLRRSPTGTTWSKPSLETSRARTCALGTHGISEAAASSQGSPCGSTSGGFRSSAPSCPTSPTRMSSGCSSPAPLVATW
jgi:hypothetical protein